MSVIGTLSGAGGLARAALPLLAIGLSALSIRAGAAERAVPDIVIGMLAREGQDIVLTRCDAAGRRYGLVDAPGSDAVAGAGKGALPAYGEVRGSPAEKDGHSVLRVTGIDHLTPGRDCRPADAANRPVAESADAARPDPAFVGHYYLSGVMETGSELLLAADGSFQWSMIYGSRDLFTQGRWRRDGDTVVLVNIPPPPGKPLFAYLETRSWDMLAEEEALRRKHETAAAAVRKACPFLADDRVSAPAATRVATDEAKPKPAAILRQQAADARTGAVAARIRVETLAREVMAKAPSREDRAIDEARAHQMLSAWLDAKEQAWQAAQAAGLPDPRLGTPALPAACDIPPMEQARNAPETWVGGIGAHVFEPNWREEASGVQVTLRFADGREEKVVTGEHGLAVMPGKVAQGVVGATLHFDYAPGRDASFTFAPVTNGIIHFSIDGRQLMDDPPFESLRLKISGEALIPERFGRGRYERSR